MSSGRIARAAFVRSGLAFFICVSFLPIFGETVVWTKTDADPYTHVAFSHNGAFLAVGREDSNTSDLLSATDGSLLRTFSGRHNGINDLLFTLDDSYLLTGAGQGGATISLSLWSVVNGMRLIGPLGDHTNGTQSISLSPDGTLLATSGRFDRDINIWQVPDMALVRNIVNEQPGSNEIPPRVKDVAFSADGQLIASADLHGVKIRGIDGSLVRIMSSEEPNSIAFSPDGLYIAAAIANERAVRMWRVADGQQVRTFSISTPFDFPQIAFAPNSRALAAGYNTGADGGAIIFWNTRTGRVVSQEIKSGAVISIAFSPKGNTYAYTQFDGHITVATTPPVW